MWLWRDVEGLTQKPTRPKPAEHHNNSITQDGILLALLEMPPTSYGLRVAQVSNPMTNLSTMCHSLVGAIPIVIACRAGGGGGGFSGIPLESFKPRPTGSTAVSPPTYGSC